MLAALDAGQHYIDKEVQANAGTDSLRGLVRLLAPLAGRKTVVLFSEGLSITNGSIDRWHRLQNEANRHNVAFYTFDAMGLRVQSQQAAMGRGIRPAVRRRNTQLVNLETAWKPGSRRCSAAPRMASRSWPAPPAASTSATRTT